MGRRGTDAVGLGVIGDPVDLGGLVGEIVLGGGGDEDVAVDIHQVCGLFLVVGAACHQIVGGGELEAAHADAGIIIMVGGVHDLQNVDHGGPAVEGLGTGLGTVLEEGHTAGVVVAVVHGQQALAVHPDELVEGVADVAVAAVQDSGELVGDGHVADADGDHHIGLVIQTVVGGVHLVAGADIEDAAAAVEAQGTGLEGGHGVGTVDAGVVHLFPVLGVADDAEDFLVVVLLIVFLAHHHEVVVGVHTQAAEDGQLQGDLLAGAEVEVLVVVFHNQLVVNALGADVFAVFTGQVGVDGCGPALGVDIPVVVQIVAGGGGGCRQSRGYQPEDQHQRKNQGNDSFHGDFSFPLFGCYHYKISRGKGQEKAERRFRSALL